MFPAFSLTVSLVPVLPPRGDQGGTETTSSFHSGKLSLKASVAWVIRLPEGEVNVSQGAEKRIADDPWKTSQDNLFSALLCIACK